MFTNRVLPLLRERVGVRGQSFVMTGLHPTLTLPVKGGYAPDLSFQSNIKNANPVISIPSGWSPLYLPP